MKNALNTVLAILFTLAMASADPAKVQQVSAEQTAVRAGQTLTATVQLETPAPEGGLQVELWSDESLDLPSYVTVPAGQTSASFQIKTSAESGNTTARFAAIQPDASASESLQLYSSTAITQK